MSHRAALWDMAVKKISVVPNVAAAAEIEYVLNYLKVHHPDIFSGWPLPLRSDQEIVQLARDLSYKATGASLQVRFNFLATGFEIGNRNYGWKVPLVPQLVRIKKPINWATPDRFEKRGAAKILEMAFGKDLERPLSDDPVVQFGQILFSAVFFGCLLERKWLPPFLTAVAQRQFFQYKTELWVEMNLEVPPPSQEASDAQAKSTFYTKRFFPDNFTASLLYRALDRGLVPTNNSLPRPWDCLQAYFKSLPGIASSERPKSLDTFLNISISRNLFIPGSMLAYASGHLKSTSLAIRPWLRCLSGKAIPVTKPKTQAQLMKESVPRIVVPKELHAKRQEELFSSLLQQLSPKGHTLSTLKASRLLDEFLQKHKKEISPAFQLLVHWGKQLLKQRLSYLEHRTKKQPLRVSSVARYFRAINTPFLMAADDQNIITIDPLELELIYECAIESRPEDYMAPRCLEQFHGYLETFFGLPPIESVTLKSNAGRTGNENANLITLDLYRLVLQGLGWGQSHTRWQRLQILGWIICYRCGLRPSEVLNLRMIDVQVVSKHDFELLVRRKTKSVRGLRRVPAALLMPQEESCFLLEYYHQRCKEKGVFGDYQFLAHPDQKSGKLAEEDLYSPIRTLLRTISLDETLRLYHARHTYSSTLQAQFLLRDKRPGILNLDIAAENDSKLRKALMASEDCGRKDQHVQAILIGHASPELTNQFYNHLNDVLLGSLVRQKRDMVPMSIKSVIMLGGIAQSWAAEMLGDQDQHPLTTLVEVKAKKYSSLLLHPLLQGAQSLCLPKAPTMPKGKLPSWDEVVTIATAESLKRGEANWEIACCVYKGVCALDGKRFRSSVGIISEMKRQWGLPSRRWRGPTYTSVTALRAVLRWVMDVGIAPSSILLVYHPRRGLAPTEQAVALRRWQTKINAGVDGWLTGEPGNASLTPSKGAVEIRIVNPGGGKDHQRKRQPAMSKGFEMTIDLIYSNLPKVEK